MPQRILNRNEIRLLTGIVRNHRLSFSSNEKDKVLKSLQGKIEDLLEATFRTAIQNKGFQNPIEVAFSFGILADQKRFQVCRNGYNLAKDLFNLGLTGITRFKDHERFFVVIEYCGEPSV